MSNKKIVLFITSLIVILTFIDISVANKSLKRKQNSESETPLVTYTVTDESIYLESYLIDSSSVTEESSSEIESSSIETSSVEKKKKKKTETTTTTAQTEPTITTYIPEEVIIVEETIEEPVEETTVSEVEKETTSSQIEEYIVFKPSTHYVHRSTCHWVSSECYEITSTDDIEARKCSECKPDIKIKHKYEEPKPDASVSNPAPTGSNHLTRQSGVYYGPSGKETYYNLDMSGVVSIMRNLGFDSKNYPYWVREDGCKMLGPYIMCAANLNTHPRGTTVESSLGTCLVCDTGGFAYSNANQLDIATTW